MDQDSQQQARDSRRAAAFREMLDMADNLRPAVVSVVEFAVSTARLAIGMPEAPPDEIWAATVVNVADALGLDLDDTGQRTAAGAIAELVMRLAGKPGES